AIDQRKRRKEQNRAAQRAFRERKERYVKELEDKIKEIETAHKIEVTQLRQEIEELKSKNEQQQQQQQQQVATVVSPTVTEACIRDKDGVSFCERLKEEVCSNAFDQLLTEPLFDSHGFLNETLASHPVPIVTSEKSRFEKFNELEQFLNNNTVPLQEPGTVDLISCSTVWSRMESHPLFEKFDLDELCNELKKKAKCSKTGPVFEEYEVQGVLDKMEEKARNQEQSL
ncbi:transcription factor PAP1-domain-containing protein, partial [Pilaira anomala]